jgi:hypothetical protein
MKLSDFKLKKVLKKIVFVDNKTEILDNMEINGEVSFYAINEEVIINIHNVMKNSISEGVADDEVAFAIIPFVCDIEVDVTLDDFSEMLKSPSKQLMDFMSLVLESMRNALDTIKTLSNIEKNVQEIIEEDPKTAKENLLNELYSQLSETTDREIKIQLLRNIANLENELVEVE